MKNTTQHNLIRTSLIAIGLSVLLTAADGAAQSGPFVAWGSYLGGTGNEEAHGIAVDSSGNVYATGCTTSSGWVSGWDTSYGGGYDAYVVKLSTTGTHVWSTYLGGTGLDLGFDITVDMSGNTYAVGTTVSSGWVTGGWDTTLGGSSDGYVVKLDTTGAHLWSSYLGGTGDESGQGIAVDSSGNVYATGSTGSLAWVTGGWDTTLGGSSDGYVVKLDTAGVHLWSTYLGGTDWDAGSDIAADLNGNVYAMGSTNSSGWVTGGCDTTLGGSSDGYVVKLDTAGAHLWSTYLGGTDTDEGWGVAVDSSGNVYATGCTNSSGWVSGGCDTSYGGDYDAYVVKLSVEGAHVWSTYLGGTVFDLGFGIAVDSSGNGYVTGYTASWGWVSGGWNTSPNGSNDGYVVKFDATGAHLWSSYFGGTMDDFGEGIVVDSSGNIYVAGISNSSDWVSGGWDTTLGGLQDGYVMKIMQTAPSNPGATAIGIDTITWTWEDNSTNETGFKIHDDPGAGSPTTLQMTTVANEESWSHGGLNTNTQYAFQVCATSVGGDSALTPNYTGWTLIEPVSGLMFSDVGTNQISVASSNTLSNLASGNSGMYFANTTTVKNNGWQQNNTPWVSDGLNPNTEYSFTGWSRNGVGVETTPVVGSAWTSAATPVAPLVFNPGVGTLDVVIVAGDGNPASTLYAIQVDPPPVEGYIWVQEDGSLGLNPVYQTAAEWAVVTVTGLEQGWTYSVQVIAQNGAGVDTSAGTAANGTVSPQVPVAGMGGLAVALLAMGFLGTLRLRRRMK